MARIRRSNEFLPGIKDRFDFNSMVERAYNFAHDHFDYVSGEYKAMAQPIDPTSSLPASTAAVVRKKVRERIERTEQNRAARVYAKSLGGGRAIDGSITDSDPVSSGDHNRFIPNRLSESWPLEWIDRD
jgi:hypothetical protein